MKVVVAGGSGFLGHALIAGLASRGYDAVVLSRSDKPTGGIRTVRWDGRSVGAWRQELVGARAVVNLAGSSLLRRWNLPGRKEILDSRVEPTSAIGAALAGLNDPPPVWINASAVGFYGDRGDETVDEESPPGSGFLSDVCTAWESAQTAGEHAGVRKVAIRIGLPLSSEGGVLPAFAKLARLFLGSAMGTGRQWVPWIDLDDFVALFLWCIESEVAGPVVASAPNPVRNAELMANLRERFGRPWVPPVPALALRAAHALGAPPPELALMSSRAVPAKALALGFRFQCETLDQSLDRRLGRER